MSGRGPRHCSCPPQLLLCRARGQLRSLKLSRCSATTQRALASIRQHVGTLEHLSLVDSCAAEAARGSGSTAFSATDLAMVGVRQRCVVKPNFMHMSTFHNESAH